MTLDSILIYLPERLSKALINLNAHYITEIRLRTNAPASVTCEKGNVTFDSKGFCVTPVNGIVITSAELNSCVSALCKHSRYSFEETIKNGFIPLEGGGRAGVCGKMVISGGKIISMSEITSLNIRLNSFIPNIAKDSALLMKRSPCGMLVFSPPGVGKTTYLKSLIYLLSTGAYTKPYRIGVIDERFELSEGIPQKGFCDFLCGINKNYAIELLTRTMSPEIIICDEISKDDVSAIQNGCNAGVSFICSAHGNSIDGIKRRDFISKLLEQQIFSYAVGIEKSFTEYKYKITEF